MSELLKPRYEVTIPYPLSPYKVGDIVDTCENGTKFKVAYFQGETFVCTESEMNEFGCFSLLHWWEKRELSEMPRFIRAESKFEIGKVGYFDIEALGGWRIENGCFWVDRTMVFNSHDSVTPATEAEYLEFIKK